MDGSDIYVGGEFIEAGSIAASHIAKWNGSQWSNLGGGVDEDGSVSSIAIGNGIVFAAGGFSRAGSARAFNVARWDGSVWQGLGGTDEYVAGVAFWKGEVIAVGDFEEAGDVSVDYAARWSPETGFRALGEGFTWLSLTGEVNAIATHGPDHVYAGGDFTTAGGYSIEDLAMWDGVKWHPLGDGVNGLVNDLLVVGETLYVAGAFTEAGGIPARGIARWNLATKTWSSLGSGINGSVFTLEPGPDGTLYVGGNFTAAGQTEARNLAIWNPADGTWSKTPFSFPVAILSGCYCVRALRADAGGVFVGGTFPHILVNATRIEARSIFYWDRAANEARTMGGGVSRNSGNTDVTGTVHDIAIGPSGEVYIAGSFDKVSGIAAASVARLSAAGWQPLGAGLAHTDRLVDPAALRFLGLGGQLIVVGRFTSAGEGRAYNAAIWDLEQSKWGAFGSGFLSDTSDEQVSSVAASSTALYFGGEFVEAGAAPAASFSRWAPKAEEPGLVEKTSTPQAGILPVPW